MDICTAAKKWAFRFSMDIYIYISGEEKSNCTLIVILFIIISCVCVCVCALMWLCIYLNGKCDCVQLKEMHMCISAKNGHTVSAWIHIYLEKKNSIYTLSLSSSSAVYVHQCDCVYLKGKCDCVQLKGMLMWLCAIKGDRKQRGTGALSVGMESDVVTAILWSVYGLVCHTFCCIK